jgi:hypothetical protein
MTIEEAYNKLVDRLEYINEELSIYPNIKTVEGRAYHIGTIYQHVREAAQVIADYKKQLHPINQDYIGVLNPSSHTHIAGEAKSDYEVKPLGNLTAFHIPSDPATAGKTNDP